MNNTKASITRPNNTDIKNTRLDSSQKPIVKPRQINSLKPSLAVAKQKSDPVKIYCMGDQKFQLEYEIGKNASSPIATDKWTAKEYEVDTDAKYVGV